MQRQWFGDRRDLLKWTVVAELAERGFVERVVWVAFLPEAEDETSVHPEVWKFFRGLAKVEELAAEIGIELDSLEASFDSRRRSDYVVHVMSLLQRSDPRRCLVLVDPDTGVAKTRVTPRHVDTKELKQIWEELRSGDWLAVYQHRWRDRRWREKAMSQLKEVVPDAVVKIDYRPGIVTDAAILLARRK